MISALGDVRGRRIADIAAGTGYLTKALSRRVGPSGRAFITTPVSQWLVVARRPQR
jgi:ubiquinone/menaquinone biosynthesis C-methylase UbiE